MRSNKHLIDLVEDFAVDEPGKKPKHPNAYISNLGFFFGMLPEIQVTVKKNTKMFGVIFPFNGNIIEGEMGWLGFLYLRENDLDSLLRYIRIELHFTLESPILYCLKVPNEFSMSYCDAPDSGEKGWVVRKKLDVRWNIISEIVNIDQK